jgi:hypothetical protein
MLVLSPMTMAVGGDMPVAVVVGKRAQDLMSGAGLMPQPVVIELLTSAHARGMMGVRGISTADITRVLANRHAIT